MNGLKWLEPNGGHPQISVSADSSPTCFKPLSQLYFASDSLASTATPGYVNWFGSNLPEVFPGLVRLQPPRSFPWVGSLGWFGSNLPELFLGMCHGSAPTSPACELVRLQPSLPTWLEPLSQNGYGGKDVNGCRGVLVFIINRKT